MEQLAKFDEELKKINDYNRLMTKIGIILLSVFGYLMLFIPDLDTPLYFIIFEMFFLSMSLYIKQFLYTTIDNKPVPIFQILKNTPVSRDIFCKDRYVKLKNYLLKMGVGCIILKTLGLIVFKETNPKTILISYAYIAFILVLFMAFVTIDIKRSTRL